MPDDDLPSENDAICRMTGWKHLWQPLVKYSPCQRTHRNFARLHAVGISVSALSGGLCLAPSAWAKLIRDVGRDGWEDKKSQN